MKHIPRYVALALFIAASSPLSAYACQYNVRDVGFVDLGSDLSQFIFVRESPSPSLERVAEGGLLESNVAFNALSPADLEGKTWAGNMADTPLFLLGPDGRTLPLAESAESEAALKEAVQAALVSPLRQALQEAVAKQYAVVLVVEGSNREANAAAHDAARSAIIRATAKMAMLPKEIAEPPVAMTLAPDAYEAERVLLWSLGIDTPGAAPHAAVLYGRARVIGNVLEGEDITTERIASYLDIVGADCECGLDRSWMQGHMIPMRWDRTWQERLAHDLGFDPENPMVKMEMSTAIGKNAHKEPVTGDMALPDVMPLSMGYQETAIVFDSEEDSDADEIALAATDSEPEPAKVESPVVTPEREPAAAPVTADAGNRNLLYAVGAVVLLGGCASAFIALRAKRNVM